jgi:hypothetical protein
VLSEGDTYYTLDLGVPDGYDEITTLGDDATGSYGLSGFEGYIVAGSDTSALGTDKTIDIYTSEYANDVVVVAEGGGLSINLGSDLNSQSDVLSFRGNDWNRRLRIMPTVMPTLPLQLLQGLQERPVVLMRLLARMLFSVQKLATRSLVSPIPRTYCLVTQATTPSPVVLLMIYCWVVQVMTP